MPRAKRRIRTFERNGTVARGRVRAEVEILRLRKTGHSKTQHVLPGRAEGWDVKKGSSYRATRHFDTKKEAEQFARRLCRNQDAELVLHRQDGQLQNGSVE
jgi:hypothetical protein